MSNTKYNIKDMSDDIDEIIKQKQNNKTNSYFQDNALNSEEMKKIKKDNTKVQNQRPVVATQPLIEDDDDERRPTITHSTFRSMYITFTITSLALVALNPTHLIFVLILPLVFMLINFFSSKYLNFLMTAVSCSLIGAYMSLFFLPMISYDSVNHWIPQWYLGLRFSDNANDYIVFLLYKSFISACLFAVFFICVSGFNKAVEDKTPLFKLSIKNVFTYLLITIIVTIAIFESLNFVTGLFNIYNKDILAIAIPLISGGFTFLIKTIIIK